MKWCLLLGLGILALGCKDTAHVAIHGGAQGLIPIEGLSRYALTDPITEGNLTIVPVVLVDKPDEPPALPKQDYVTLAEAHKNGWVEIHELPNSAQVNTLEVKNLGPKPLLLLAGELLLGGKQDRVVAKDTIVPPESTLEVPVFCVEHGRWSGSSEKFSYSDTTVPNSVRREAAFSNQQQVWESVAEYNAKTKSLPSYGTSVRGGLATEEVQGRLRADLSKIRAELDKRGDVVGMVCVVNGRIDTLEIFGDPKLFKASRDSILRGFLADAASVSDEAFTSTLDKDACAKFVAGAMNGERRQTGLARGHGNWRVAPSERSRAMGFDGEGIELSAGSAAANKPEDSTLIHGSYSNKAP
jgi:hypothetical protein